MNRELWNTTLLTAEGSFTQGIEGPSCDAFGTLYVCNAGKAGTVGVVRGQDVSVFLELPQGSVGNGMVFDPSGHMYLADYVGHTIYKLELEGKKLSVHCHEPRMHQPNDLAIRSDGTIFASDPHWLSKTGQVWRVTPAGNASLVAEEMGTTNGLELSPDETTLYVNETVQQCIWAFDIDAHGNLNNKRLFYRFEEHLLDGMRCDEAGNLFVTRYGGSKITVLSSTGKILRDIPLLGKDCTNLAFGGEDGRTCFVTLADKGYVEAFKTEHPGRNWKLLEDIREKRI
ncbi:MAG: SMP-30/gluconolactonase/LRE family protein [Trueperaceae bacterium]